MKVTAKSHKSGDLNIKLVLPAAATTFLIFKVKIELYDWIIKKRGIDFLPNFSLKLFVTKRFIICKFNLALALGGLVFKTLINQNVGLTNVINRFLQCAPWSKNRSA
ncbi:hypothetical protein ACOME3_010812, partial [Neoechinorhynchus agilis]